MKLALLVLILLVQPNSGCYSPPDFLLDRGGADDLVTVHMPFTHGYRSMCTQGPNGAHSHRGFATRHDLDFDTPNDRNDIVYAPVTGTVHVHNNPDDGFGRHANIDLGDGTHVTLGHLEQILVNNLQEVGPGSVIGFEGTTGNSDGDHVHMGRHWGSAANPTGQSESIDTLAVISRDTQMGETTARGVHDFHCGLPGRIYESSLPLVKSVADGGLAKSPYSPDVYLVEKGVKRLYEDEQTFWNDHRSFAEVVTVGPETLACYPDGTGMPAEETASIVSKDGNHWLLLDNPGTPGKQRVLIEHQYLDFVLTSWGMTAEDVVETDSAKLSKYQWVANVPIWREGTVLKEQNRSDIFVTVEGIAFPVLNWDVFARLGLGSRPLITLPAGMLAETVQDTGNCAAGYFCIDHNFAESCGASLAGQVNAVPAEEVEDTDEPGDFGAAIEPSEENSDESNGPSDSDNAADTEAPEDSPTDSGQSTTPVSPSSGTAPLTVEWNMPAGLSADTLTLSGVYAPQGVEGWWSTLAQGAGSSIGYTVPQMNSGDHFRFSVEFRMGTQTSWSCLAPFPPGVLQGATAASWNGQALSVLPAGDPAGSPGCGLKVTIP